MSAGETNASISPPPAEPQRLERVDIPPLQLEDIQSAVPLSEVIVSDESDYMRCKLVF
jgi:hypothetical protein